MLKTFMFWHEVASSSRARPAQVETQPPHIISLPRNWRPLASDRSKADTPPSRSRLFAVQLQLVIIPSSVFATVSQTASAAARSMPAHRARQKELCAWR